MARGVVGYWARGIGVGGATGFGEGGGAWSGGVVVGVRRLCGTGFGDGGFGGEDLCRGAGRREIDVIERVRAFSFLRWGQRGEALLEVVEAAHISI